MDDDSVRYLAEIRLHYDAWHEANVRLRGPLAASSDSDSNILSERVALLEEYKRFIDQQQYAEQFDSRSNLHSSVLEEWAYYLFKDVVAEFGNNALIGKSKTFKDIFFTPERFLEMVDKPRARIETKDHDFVIGTTVEAIFRSTISPERDEQKNQKEVITALEPSDYGAGTVTDDAEAHKFDLPAVAIECKTYLDKTMMEGASRAAEDLKARNPNSLYIVVAEWLKLTESINLRKFKVDQIYILRKQKNTDREDRYKEEYIKNPIDVEVVEHLFNTVRQHLTSDWSGGVEQGLAKGWLL